MDPNFDNHPDAEDLIALHVWLLVLLALLSPTVLRSASLI